MTPTIFFSRSAIETMDKCPVKWYWEYAYEGKGIRPEYTSIPLTTGTAVHKGVGYLLNCLQIGQVLDAERVLAAVQVAKDEYEKIVKSQYKGVESNYGNEYTFIEQSNLTAALVILWALSEGKEIVRDYEIVEVEREERFRILPSNECRPYNVDFEARADAILKSKRAKNDYLVYSLKTAKRFYDSQRESLKHDLQGITETLAVRNRWQEEDTNKSALLDHARLAGFSKKHLEALETVCKNNSGKSLIGVRYCVLVKGDYKEPWEGADFRVTHNPLIRGYKKIDVAEKFYAHSWYFPNPNNKSGKGALGKGWEPFRVWEEFELADWISGCWLGEIQPQAKQEIEKLVQTFEVYRNREELETTKQELVTRLDRPEVGLAKLGKINPSELPFFFEKRRASCHYYPGEANACEYIPICHQGRTPEVGNGWEWREPHHEGEKEG